MTSSRHRALATLVVQLSLLSTAACWRSSRDPVQLLSDWSSRNQTSLEDPPVSRGVASRQQDARWNLISIVTDDQAVWSVGAYGYDEAHTPNMDRLASEGVLFTNAFAASGVCTPSRVAFLTGLYPIQAGFPDVPYRRDIDEGLPLGVPSWPRVLQEHGYTTGLIGKWHLGFTRENHPTNYGIDYFYGFQGGGNRPIDPILERDGEIGVVPGPTPDVLVDDAIRFLERHRADRFALMLHFRAPHAPHLPVPEADLEPFADLDPTVPVVDPADALLDDDQEPADPAAIALHVELLKEKVNSYYASVHSVDRNLGRLLAKLDELGLTGNTIVMFQSDQGYLFGHRGLKGKGGAQPIRNHTLQNNVFVVNMFDVALRIPLIVRWPGVARPGAVREELVSNIDTYASVLGMLGVPKPIDASDQSRDFSPLIRGEPVTWRDAVFSEYTPDQIGAMNFSRMIRTDRWKLVRSYLNGGGNELYDLAADPGEVRNLYYSHYKRVPLLQYRGERRGDGEHPYADVLDDLQSRLSAWQRSIGDPAPALERRYLEDKRDTRARWGGGGDR